MQRTQAYLKHRKQVLPDKFKFKLGKLRNENDAEDDDD